MIPSTRFPRWITLSVLATFACAPRAGKLVGTPAPALFPQTELPRGNQRIVFRWDYIDQALAAKGEGVARIASPDSVRLDFFLDGGLGGGYAIVIGDSVSTPGGDQVRRYLPPVALLWASLGRLAVPPVPDTVAKVDGGRFTANVVFGDEFTPSGTKFRIAGIVTRTHEDALKFDIGAKEQTLPQDYPQSAVVVVTHR